ncbi:MAG: response regulator transcription factor [Halioglobus sp.]|nr:response regulator transcription factor [Halioglobus sp.]
MGTVLVSPEGHARERWCVAFPDATVVSTLSGVDAGSASSLWLDLCNLDAAQRRDLIGAAMSLAGPVVAMVAVPAEDDAFAAMQAGAQGYCHVKAAPEQLREIALVVEHGGLWMPTALMQRLVAVSSRVLAQSSPVSPRLGDLTARELAVAELVGRGGSNREIAMQLSISERTVKSHLTAIFDKLGVRDRVQLALAMHDIPAASTVD